MQANYIQNFIRIEPRFGETVGVTVNKVMHPGIYVGNNNVIDNSLKRKGVCLVSLNEFCDGRELHYLGFAGKLSAHEIVQRAYEALGTPYNLPLFNCKDFVRDVQGRSLATAIIKAGVAMGAVGVAVSILRRS